MTYRSLKKVASHIMKGQREWQTKNQHVQRSCGRKSLVYLRNGKETSMAEA